MGDIDWSVFGWGREPDHPAETCGPWCGSMPYIPQRWGQTRIGSRGAFRCADFVKVYRFSPPMVRVTNHKSDSLGWWPLSKWLAYGEVLDG